MLRGYQTMRQGFSGAHLLPSDTPFSTADEPISALCPVHSRVEYPCVTSPERSKRIPMKRVPSLVVALLLAPLAALAQQPPPALSSDARPDTGAMNADV